MRSIGGGRHETRDWSIGRRLRSFGPRQVTSGGEPCSRLYLPPGRLLAMSTTIRVSEETRDRLASLADATGRPMTRVLDEAVDALERKVFFDTLNRRYEELRNDSGAWSEIEQERRAEEGAVGDASE